MRVGWPLPALLEAAGHRGPESWPVCQAWPPCCVPSTTPAPLAPTMPLSGEIMPVLGVGWLWTRAAEAVASSPCKWGLCFPGSPKHWTPGPAVRTGVSGPCLISQERIQERRQKVKCKAKGLLKRKVSAERRRANSERESCLGEV